MNLIDILKAYPYFFASLLSVLILLTAGMILLTQQQWHVMILSGLFSVPCFPFLIFLEKEYWSPARLGGWVLGAEDVFCSFWVAAMVWFAVALPLRNKIVLNGGVRIFWRCYAIIAGISVSLFLLFYLMKFGGMSSLLLAYAVAATILVLQNRRPWPLSIAGILLFPILYLALVKLFFEIWPDFVHQWNALSFWGSTISGMPRGEITWAIIFGFYWPLSMAYVFNI